jgi:hypothetical protein
MDRLEENWGCMIGWVGCMNCDEMMRDDDCVYGCIFI